MDELKLVWTQTALRQRNHVFDYWNNRNKSTSYSKRLNRTILQIGNLLKQHPDFGTNTLFKNIQVVYFEYYGLYYLKTEKAIIIVGFWNHRQDPKKLLAFLKNHPS